MSDETYDKRKSEDYTKRYEIGKAKAVAFYEGVNWERKRYEYDKNFILEYADHYARHRGNPLSECFKSFLKFGTIDPVPDFIPDNFGGKEK